MIKEIIEMLQIDDFINESEFIEIAKGKYKLHTSWGKAIKQGKRIIKNIKNGRN